MLAQQTTIDQLPQLKSWPDDGGAYITLPQVYTEDPERPGLEHSQPGHVPRAAWPAGNIAPNREVGLHYQIHRGIGAHHAAAIRRKERLRVNVFVGGPPAMTVAAVMPLPEGISELAFAGVLGGRRVPMICRRAPRADPRRGRLLHHRASRSRRGSCPRGLSAITWATTAWRTSFP